MSIKFNRETLTSDLIKEALPLLKIHHEEVALYKDTPIDPDYDIYDAMCKSGITRTFTARKENGEMVGYSVFILRNHPHYKTVLQAYQDVLYITKECRGMGKEFLPWCDEQLKKDGVATIYRHVTIAHDFSELLKRIGYDLSEYVYAKQLDKEGD